MFFKLKDLNVKNKRVIVRVDLNTPLDDKGNVSDDTRIKAALPTIKYLIKNKARIILMSHLGRPKGEVIEKLKLKKVAERLETELNQVIIKANDSIGPGIEKISNNLKEGQILLLENLRFYKEEKENNSNFASSLADLADYYVNDAFGTCHRAHASVEAITRYLPSAAGFLLEKEIDMLSKTKDPKKPFVAVMGGAKISDKISIIESLLKKVDKLLIGGAMAFTFLKSEGLETGKSLVEDDKLVLARKLLKNPKILIPMDIVVADKFEENSKSTVVLASEIPKDKIGLDIGPDTIKYFNTILNNANTIVWNGPMGVFEWKKFSNGTNEIAKTLAKSKAVTIVGGGESAEAIKKLKLQNKITHISTGGGAALEFLEGKTLPGIKALEDSYKRFKDQI